MHPFFRYTKFSLQSSVLICYLSQFHNIEIIIFLIVRLIVNFLTPEITIVIISPILFTSYAAFAAALAAFSFAAFLSAIDCLTAVNTATQIPKTKNAPIG